MKILVLVEGREDEIRDKERLFSYMPNNVQIDLLGTLSFSKTSFLYQPEIERFFYCMIQVSKAFLYGLACRYDLVISFGSLKGILFSFLQRVLKLGSPPHIIEESSSLPLMAFSNKLIDRILFNITRFAVSSSAKIMCYTKTQRDFWNCCLGSRSRAVFVPFGIPSSFLNQQNDEKIQKYVFSGGRTARDFSTLVSMAKDIPISFIIACGTQSLIELREVTLPENVKLLFEIPFSKFKDLIAGSLFTVLPLKDVPYSSGICVLLTCMAMGKAVIVTKNSTSIDYVYDGETGIFVRPYDANGMKKKVIHLIENPKEAKRIGENARNVVTESFLEPIMAKRYWEVINETFNQKQCARMYTFRKCRPLKK